MYKILSHNLNEIILPVIVHFVNYNWVSPTPFMSDFSYPFYSFLLLIFIVGFLTLSLIFNLCSL